MKCIIVSHLTGAEILYIITICSFTMKYFVVTRMFIVTCSEINNNRYRIMNMTLYIYEHGYKYYNTAKDDDHGHGNNNDSEF